MMYSLLSVMALLSSISAGQRVQQKAVSVLVPDQANPIRDLRDVRGMVTFERINRGRDRGNTRIYGEVFGLQRNQEYGIHVHEFGDISSNNPRKPIDCLSTGAHYDPFNTNHHAGRNDPKGHLGDLGKIKANRRGVAKFDFVDKYIKIDGRNGIIGRGFVVHQKADDFRSQPTGDAGGRPACGTIGIAEQERRHRRLIDNELDSTDAEFEDDSTEPTQLPTTDSYEDEDEDSNYDTHMYSTTDEPYYDSYDGQYDDNSYNPTIEPTPEPTIDSYEDDQYDDQYDDNSDDIVDDSAEPTQLPTVDSYEDIETTDEPYYDGQYDDQYDEPTQLPTVDSYEDDMETTYAPSYDDQYDDNYGDVESYEDNEYVPTELPIDIETTEAEYVVTETEEPIYVTDDIETTQGDYIESTQYEVIDTTEQPIYESGEVQSQDDDSHFDEYQYSTTNEPSYDDVIDHNDDLNTAALRNVKDESFQPTQLPISTSQGEEIVTEIKTTLKTEPRCEPRWARCHNGADCCSGRCWFRRCVF